MDLMMDFDEFEDGDETITTLTEHQGLKTRSKNKKAC